MPATNNVTRLLTSQKINFTVYQLPEEKLGAKETAHLLGVDPAVVYKTIVILREKPGKSILAIIPGNRETDLKAIAALIGDKKVRVASQKEAERLTKLQAGGISPLALINQGFQTILDSTAKDFTHIHISGGQRGINIKLATKDLVNLTRAKIGSISQETITD